ncbi:MAG: TlpA disulfide reductase family protein [Bacteriovoracaceae bacterium]
MFKIKKFFPLLLSILAFIALLIAQMSIHGTSSSAGKLNIGAEKAQAYEAKFGNLAFTTTKGTKLDFSKVSQPIVILNFWASWCRPCLSEFETLKKLVSKYGPEKVLVIGVNNDAENPKKAVKKVEKDLDLNFESMIDLDGSVAKDFFISEIPASIVFHKGKVVHFENREFDFMSKKFLGLIDQKLALE